jgi:hypothetical protein
MATGHSNLSKLKGELFMNETEGTALSRKDIGLRLLYTLLYLIALEVVKLVIQVTVLFQFIYLLINRKYSEPLRAFSNRLSAYAYRLIRYVTLNENARPFPFTEFPAEMDGAEEPVHFG